MSAALSSDAESMTVAGDVASPRTLLVVDDELGPRQSLQMVFKDDYDVLLADGGEQALEVIRNRAVHAAILDIRMAGMSGVELLEQLKRHDPAIEVIMLTAYETIETARQALKHGACDYLTKPFDLDTIRGAVASAMDRRALTEQQEASLGRLRDLQEELQNQKIQEEIVRAKGEIYASVLHDINGPLTIISGFVDIINNRIQGVSSVDGESLDLIRDRLTRITRQVNNCIEISQRYLSFLRHPSPAGMTVSLRQVLKDVQELLQVHPSMRNNQLKVGCPEKDLLAEVNGANLIQLVLNLAINGLQASDAPHLVEITAERVLEPLDLGAIIDGPESRFINREGFRNAPPMAAVTVRDSGQGIPPQVMEEIFRPRAFGDYFSTKQSLGGTGLGIAIVQRFVREGQGALRVRTCLGEGTTFTAYFTARP